MNQMGWKAISMCSRRKYIFFFDDKFDASGIGLTRVNHNHETCRMLNKCVFNEAINSRLRFRSGLSLIRLTAILMTFPFHLSPG
jgi:hypothetical protein